MPTREKHLEIVDRNYGALTCLCDPDPSDYTEWCVVVIYYMAFHYVQAYLDVKIGEHPTSHAVIQSRIRDIPQLKTLYGKYRRLEEDSRKARYDGEKFSIYTMRNTTLRNFKEIQKMIFSLLDIRDREEYDLYPLFPSG